MYHKIFKPQVFHLPTGERVDERRSMAPVYLVLVVLVLIFSLHYTEFRFAALFEKGNRFWDILLEMVPPNKAYFKSIVRPLSDTVKMSFVGSLLGSLSAVPFAVLASSNMIRSKLVNGIIRLLLTFLRTLPTLVTALIATYVFGLGTFAGTVAIFLFSFSYIGKQLFEQIETVDMGPFEAVESLGASRPKAFLITIVPQLLPAYLSVSLFNFEGNVRYAAILGYVGAGGIGIILNDRINNRDYPSVGMILIVLLVTVIAIELLSRFIRKKLT